MANTALLAAVVRTLMEGRPPSPLAPVPSGPMTPPGGPLPLPMGPAPGPAPVAPLPARDESLIEQLTGPRPVAPVAQPVSLLQKIALALQGFGAGVQGQGPQFLAGLREERERPQREFQAATERFEQRRRGAIGVAEEKRQREQQDIQRRADIQSGREFQIFESEQRDRMQEARDLRLQAKQLEIEDRRAKAEFAEQQRKEKAANEKQRNDIIADLIKSPNFAPAKVASEIADSIVFGKPLSAAAEKWRSVQQQKAEKQLERLSRIGGGGGQTGSVLAQLENGALVPLAMVGRESGRVKIGGQALQVVGFVRGNIPTQLPPAPARTGTGDPLIDALLSPSQSLLAPTVQGATPSPDAEAQAYAKRFGISVEQARKELRGQ